MHKSNLKQLITQKARSSEDGSTQIDKCAAIGNVIVDRITYQEEIRHLVKKQCLHCAYLQTSPVAVHHHTQVHGSPYVNYYGHAQYALQTI